MAFNKCSNARTTRACYSRRAQAIRACRSPYEHAITFEINSAFLFILLDRYRIVGICRIWHYMSSRIIIVSHHWAAVVPRGWSKASAWRLQVILLEYRIVKNPRISVQDYECFPIRVQFTVRVKVSQSQ